MQPAAFSWLRGEIHVDVVVGVVLLAGAYTWATIASRRPTPLGAPLAFFGGCAAMLAALNGPLQPSAVWQLRQLPMWASSSPLAICSRGNDLGTSTRATLSPDAPRRSRDFCPYWSG